jgi:hypothetical protein
MPRRTRDPDEERSDFIKVSDWLSSSIFYTVQAATNADDEPKFRRWRNDTQARLAMSLEAYALLLTGKDPHRVQVLIHELEIPRESLRHRRQPYFDPVEVREIRRNLARGVEDSRHRIAELEAKGILTPEEKRDLRSRRRHVESWEREN